MNYYIDLFSPETARAFEQSKRDISGFRISRKTYVENQKIGPGDRLICYVTKLMRFIGILEIESQYFIDASSIFKKKNDPFILRFNVKPLVWLPLEKAIPINSDIIWKNLSATKNLSKGGQGLAYKARLASSPFLWLKEDSLYLEKILFQQTKDLHDFPFSKNDQKKLVTKRVRRRKKRKSRLSNLDNKGLAAPPSDLVRIFQKPAEIYEWPIQNQNINLPHAFQNSHNPYPYSNKMNPAPGSIIMLRSVEDKAFVAIGFVLSSNNSSKEEQSKIKNLFGKKWSKSFYLHPFVFKNFRVRLRNVGMKPHRVPARISKDDFLRVFQRAILQIKEEGLSNGDLKNIKNNG